MQGIIIETPTEAAMNIDIVTEAATTKTNVKRFSTKVARAATTTRLWNVSTQRLAKSIEIQNFVAAIDLKRSGAHLCD
jgi:cellulase/cellobiase CelA1